MRPSCLFALTLLLLVMAASCGRDSVFPPVPDYSMQSMWYETSRDDGVTKAADVFYIAPTCIWDWTDSSGNVQHVMNVEDESQRTAVASSIFLAESLFAKSCNFYSPYYRQITMESWMLPEEETLKRYETAHSDVASAFRYYMDHFNHGRPFFLAGHSQGAKAVIEILKRNMSQEEYSRMIAAYCFGFTITGEEIEQNRMLVPAEGPADCGVVICYNSVSRPEAVSPAFSDTDVCINPLNWKTDATYAPARDNPGSVFFSSDRTSDTLFHKVGAAIDPDINTLVIDGLDDGDYFIPSISSLFPQGNYHVYEINLYYLSLQQNIADRIDSYFSAPSRASDPSM